MTKRRKQPRTTSGRDANTEAGTPRLEALTERINGWSRPLRIAMTTFTTVVLSMIVGYGLGLIMLSQETEDTTPYIVIILAFAISTYVAGWFWMVGFDWTPDKPWHARRASALFILAGMVGLVVIFIALLLGLVFGFLL